MDCWGSINKASWRLFAGVLVLAFAMGRAAGAQPEDAFVARVYTNAAGHKLPYRLLLPESYDPGKSYPVILYLHGAAARGNDNLEPLKWGPELFLEQRRREKQGFFLVVPQSPRTSGWVDSSWTLRGIPQESEALQMSLALVKDVLPKEFHLDPKRRYLTGVSMGGHAVWITLVRHPSMFAAAVPVCSGGSASIVTSDAAKVPVWAFHSDDDHLVPVQQARDLVQAWRAHGGVAKYTEYTGLRHSSWKKAYADPELLPWMFGQHLP